VSLSFIPLDRPPSYASSDCGIRPSTASEAEWLQDYVQRSNAQANANRANKEHGEGDKDNGRSDDDDDEDSEGASHSATGSKRNSLVLPGEVKNAVFGDELSDKTPTAANLLAQQAAQRPPGAFTEASIRRHAQQEPGLALSAAPSSGPNSSNYLAPQQISSVRQIPHFPTIEEALGQDSNSAHTIAAREVWGWFQDHLDALLDSIRTFRFDGFELHARTFWSQLAGQHREVVHAPAIAGLMAKADAIVYDEILEFLRLQMLSPISAQSLSNLRALAVKMEKILLVALSGYGTTFVEPKVELGARFGHLVCE
jgi:regulatory factor X, other